MKSNKDSLKIRYFFKLLTNIVGIPIGLVTESIIPRALGTKLYGDFSFITGFFQSLISFIDLGSSSAFYDKLSKRPNEKLLRKFYWKLVSLITVISSTAILFLIYSGFSSTIWPNQLPKYIIMGLIFGLLYWYSQIILKTVDAYALSKQGEIIRISQKFLRLFLIIPMYFFDFFTLGMFFIYNYIIIIFSIIGWIIILNKEGISILPKVKLSKNNLSIYYNEFYIYCLPLIAYSSIGLITGIFDRWILQISSGSIEQSFYGISFQIASVCIVFSSAMTPLIFREFSVEIKNQNFLKIRKIFKKYIPMLYSIAAYFGVFIAINSQTVGSIIGGPEFKDAYLCIAIMAFYAIHQTYGQLSSTLYYSSERTSMYKNIGGSILILGMPCSFFFISSGTYGLNLGATGLALKMIIIQLIQVNILLYYNIKFINEKFSYFIIHQILSVLFFLSIGLFSNFLISIFFQNQILSFIISGVIYSLLVIIFTYIFPYIFSLTRDDLKLYINKYFRLK